MSHELFYTSAPRGLQPGSRGFCTVAMTQGLPAPLAEKLEALSGYRPLFPPHDPRAAQNPVVLAHLRVPVGGRLVSVLSRVCAAGLDYTERTNKFAHHVVLEPGERPPGGPAWLLAQPGFVETAWDGQVRLLPVGRTPPRADNAPRPCQAWEQTTGDAGWAGVLVDAFVQDANRTAYLLFDPGTDPLPLLVEALALLPAERRWEVTFSTYFTGLPPDVTCAWRCLVRGTPEAKQAARMPGALVLTLARDAGPAPAGALVEHARTGKTVAQPVPPVPAEWPVGQVTRESARTATAFPTRHAAAAHAEGMRPTYAVAQPEPLPAAPPTPAWQPPERESKPRKRSWLSGFVMGMLLGVVIPGVGIGGFWYFGGFKGQDGEPRPVTGAANIDAQEQAKADVQKLEKRVQELESMKGKLAKQVESLGERNDKLANEKKALEADKSKLAELLKDSTEKLAAATKSQPPLKNETTAKPKPVKPPSRVFVDQGIRLPLHNHVASELRSLQSLGIPADNADAPTLLLHGLPWKVQKDGGDLDQDNKAGSVRVFVKNVPNESTDPVDLCRFEVKDGKLVFEWTHKHDINTRQIQAFHAYVRCLVLEIRGRGKSAPNYLALREVLQQDKLKQDVSGAYHLVWDPQQENPKRELILEKAEVSVTDHARKIRESSSPMSSDSASLDWSISQPLLHSPISEMISGMIVLKKDKDKQEKCHLSAKGHWEMVRVALHLLDKGQIKLAGELEPKQVNHDLRIVTNDGLKGEKLENAERKSLTKLQNDLLGLIRTNRPKDPRLSLRSLVVCMKVDNFRVEVLRVEKSVVKPPAVEKKNATTPAKEKLKPFGPNTVDQE